MKSSLHFIFLFMCIQNLFANLVIDNLFNEMKEKQTLVCVGLDPDINKMPHELLKNDLSDEENAFNFLREIIEITSPYVCCYKAQKAFFDAFEKGHDLLKSTISYIKKTTQRFQCLLIVKLAILITL